MSDLLNSASLVMIPSGYAEDKVYSVVPSDGSGDLSFTRASNGTRVNSAGLVEVTPWNLIDESERFANWNLQSTSVSNDSTTAPNGTTTADTIIELNTTDEHNRYLEPNIGGGVFTYSIYLKRFNADWASLYVFNTAVGGVRHWVNLSTLTAGTSANIGSGIGTTSLSLESVGNGWVRASISFTNPSGSCRFYVANAQSNGGATSYAGNGTNGLYAWGGQVNVGSTAKPYFPTTDRLNVPRLTYQNGGGGCPSLLLEKQSTNLYPYSEDLTQWLTIGTPTITGNNATSPDGTTNADRVQFSGSGDLVYNSGTGSAGTNTLTVYAKAKTGTAQKFRFFANGATTISSDFTATDQWQRFEYSFTFSAQTAGLQGASTGSGDVLFWGFQHEISSYPTSYIPTTSSSATRVADACFKTGISSLIGQTEGVLFVDFVFLGNSGVNRFSISDGSNANWIFIGTPEDGANLTSRFYIRTNDIVRVDVGASSYFTIGQRYKLALAYKSGDWAVYGNGALLYSGTNSIGSVTNPLSALHFFNSSGGSAEVAEKVNQAILFKTRLTNAELASLTTI